MNNIECERLFNSYGLTCNMTASLSYTSSVGEFDWVCRYPWNPHEDSKYNICYKDGVWWVWEVGDAWLISEVMKKQPFCTFTNTESLIAFLQICD